MRQHLALRFFIAHVLPPRLYPHYTALAQPLYRRTDAGGLAVAVFLGLRGGAAGAGSLWRWTLPARHCRRLSRDLVGNFTASLVER